MFFVHLMILLTFVDQIMYGVYFDTYEKDKKMGSQLGLGWKTLAIVFRVFTILSWIGCRYLLIYEYRKGLSETWSALKLFWTLNFIFLLSDTIEGAIFDTLNTEIKFTISQSLQCFANLIILILMVRTKSRTFDQPRPGLQFPRGQSNIKDIIKNKNSARSTSFGSGRPEALSFGN